jgi:hypothetical protein
MRFKALDPKDQKAIIARLLKGPSRVHWPKRIDADDVRNARLLWAVRELKRIEVAGGELPPDAKTWLSARIEQFPELATMTIEEGFAKTLEARTVPSNPDPRYDTISGITRLRALETALSSGRSGWDDDPAARANDWLRQPENTRLVLSDLESAIGGDEFPGVWNRFGWAHLPTNLATGGHTLDDQGNEPHRVLSLLVQVSEATLSAAIEGISAWLDNWSKHFITSQLSLPIWLRIWPIAVEATNARQDQGGEVDLSVSAYLANDDKGSEKLDTLNSPAGKLVGVFLTACPSLAQESNPFRVGTNVRQMRDVAISATARSGLIVRHRMIENLVYFLQADYDWAQQQLIAPLLAEGPEFLDLWRAVARRPQFTKVLRIIGDAMAERAIDKQLGRETRRSLVFSLVVETMHAFRENRAPAVSNPSVQQMLRSMDDELRATAANAIQQFVRDLSAKSSAADLFRSAAAPFLRKVWPQERSLTTPGVSSALSDLPATSGEAFSEVVETIERFLVPFDCWSMVNYGLYGDHGGTKKLTIINDYSKAKAFLRLLDLTIGSTEGAVIPHDLADALDQIKTVAPDLVETPVFRRLSAAARR